MRFEPGPDQIPTIIRKVQELAGLEDIDRNAVASEMRDLFIVICKNISTLKRDMLTSVMDLTDYLQGRMDKDLVEVINIRNVVSDVLSIEYFSELTLIILNGLGDLDKKQQDDIVGNFLELLPDNAHRLDIPLSAGLKSQLALYKDGSNSESAAKFCDAAHKIIIKRQIQEGMEALKNFDTEDLSPPKSTAMIEMLSVLEQNINLLETDEIAELIEILTALKARSEKDHPILAQSADRVHQQLT